MDVKTSFLNGELNQEILYGTTNKFHYPRPRAQCVWVKSIDLWP